MRAGSVRERPLIRLWREPCLSASIAWADRAPGRGQAVGIYIPLRKSRPLCQTVGMIDLSQETETLARRLADARHVTVDAAVREALHVSAHVAGIKLARDVSAEAIFARRERATRFVEELAALPVLDKRPLQEIVDDLNAV